MNELNSYSFEERFKFDVNDVVFKVVFITIGLKFDRFSTLQKLTGIQDLKSQVTLDWKIFDCFAIKLRRLALSFWHSHIYKTLTMRLRSL